MIEGFFLVVFLCQVLKFRFCVLNSHHECCCVFCMRICTSLCVCVVSHVLVHVFMDRHGVWASCVTDNVSTPTHPHPSGKQLCPTQFPAPIHMSCALNRDL